MADSLQKVSIYHFYNGSGGGVFSVIKNLLQYSRDRKIENHIIYTINKKLIPHFSVPQLSGATSEQIFYYSADWNFYYTCKQLSKLLPDNKAVLIAHDWLELGMVSNLGLQNPVVQILHGDFDYYYSLANKHDKSIDQFVTVSPVICNKLSIILPHRKADIHYCRFPVPSVESVEKENDLLKIIYCVRNLNEERKQFKILPLINERLGAKGLIVNWTIIGEGMNKQQVENVMQQHSLISFFPSLPNDRLIKLFPEHDLFILPSLQEGFPVAVVEAMKAGVVPLVTNWEEATKELIIENETGYYFKTGDANKYADTIELLNRNRNLLKRMAKNGVKKANELFDPYINTIMIEQLISVSYKVEKKDKKAFKAYGSRLDNPLMNNTVVNMVRKLKSRIN